LVGQGIEGDLPIVFPGGSTIERPTPSKKLPVVFVTVLLPLEKARAGAASAGFQVLDDPPPPPAAGTWSAAFDPTRRARLERNGIP
jgi:hypothetical protein